MCLCAYEAVTIFKWDAENIYISFTWKKLEMIKENHYNKRT